MNLFSDPLYALNEAQQQADWHRRPFYLLSADNQNIRVDSSYTAGEVILEVVRPRA